MIGRNNEKYLGFILKENFEVNITAKNWVCCHTLQEYFVHGYGLLKSCQIFSETHAMQSI